jgi:uncharacterized membrane protein YhaH (DUF805 family)
MQCVDIIIIIIIIIRIITLLLFVVIVVVVAAIVKGLLNRDLAQDRVQWQAFVLAVLNLLVLLPES